MSLTIIGSKIGRLTILELYRGKGRNLIAVCLCDCGQKKHIRESTIRTGEVKSCGCFRRERINRMNHKHGMAHRDSIAPEWVVWHSMRQRCENPNHKSFKDYGGRGIRVCARWSTFENFIADMGRRPEPSFSIDRKDNSAGYCPENCRWANKSEQAKNRRQPRRTK